MIVISVWESEGDADKLSGESGWVGVASGHIKQQLQEQQRDQGSGVPALGCGRAVPPQEYDNIKYNI